MRHQKQFIVITLVALSLAGCGPKTSTPTPTAPPVQTDNTAAPVQTPPAPADKPYVLVMLGDSLTAGLGLQPEQAFPMIVEQDLAARTGPGPDQRIVVRNAGVSGDTTASGLARFDWSVGPEANGIVIALGANDMLNGLDPAQTRANLTAMIEKAQARKLDVYLAGMRAAANLGTEYGAQFDRLYVDIAQQFCVPLYPFLLQALADQNGTAIDPELIQRDGLHPTGEGAARIGHALSVWLADQRNSSQSPCTP